MGRGRREPTRHVSVVRPVRRRSVSLGRPIWRRNVSLGRPERQVHNNARLGCTGAIARPVGLIGGIDFTLRDAVCTPNGGLVGLIRMNLGLILPGMLTQNDRNRAGANRQLKFITFLASCLDRSSS
jgi:hypothetical protein